MLLLEAEAVASGWAESPQKLLMLPLLSFDVKLTSPCKNLDEDPLVIPDMVSIVALEYLRRGPVEGDPKESDGMAADLRRS